MLKRALAALVLVVAINPAVSQAPNAQSFVGTVAAFKPGPQVEIKPDNRAPVDLRLTPDTTALRIAPGEKSLKNATAVNIRDLLIGDRVLVTLEPNTSNLRRVVIMSAADIRKRDEADRQDWNARGISGIVTGKNGSTIALRVRSFQGETSPTVAVSAQTKFRRYAPDSVKFSDAKPSTLAEVNVGDQLRARGEKNPDGSSVTADEVVFGTFLTIAGSVVSVDAAGPEITIKETGTGKTFSIKLTQDSKIKQMPSFPGMGGPPTGSSGPPRGDASSGPPPGGFPGGKPPGGLTAEPPAGGFAGAPPAGAPTIAQMVEMMPAATVDDLKPRQTIIVSSTKGEDADHLTAIVLLANAEMLVQMASRQAGGVAANRPGAAGNQPGFQPGGPMGGGMDLGGMLGGLGLSGLGP